MDNLSRRLTKAENALRIEEPYVGTIAGIDISSDELDKILKKLWSESKGLPIKEYQQENF